MLPQSMDVLWTTLFAVLLTAAVYAQEDCPDMAAVCPDNCLGARCPRYLNAECRENPCHGLCAPNFFRRNRNVTNRCDVETCDEKNCPRLRNCVEEVVPSTCPGNQPRCRQYIRARCVLPPSPTDCSQITCGPGMFCRERKRGEGVTCAPVRRCSQLECEEPYVCKETEEEGPTCELDLPSSCEEADCPEGTVCSVFSIPSREVSIAQCISQSEAANFPIFDQFSCSSELMICDEEREACIEAYEDGRFLTIFCNIINCPDTACTSGHECTEVPPSLVQATGIGFTKTCIPPGFVLGETCATAVDPCPPGLACHDIEFEGATIGIGCGVSAPTYSGTTCEELGCPSPLECYERDTRGRGSLAQCAPEESVDVVLEGVTHG